MIIRVVIRVILIIFSAQNGIVAVGVAFVIIGVLESITDFIQCRNVIGLTIGGIVKTLQKSILIAICSSIPSLIVYFETRANIPQKPWEIIFISAVPSIIIWVAMIFITKHPLHKEITHSLTIITKRTS
jgi:hypothetical protein